MGRVLVLAAAVVAIGGVVPAGSSMAPAATEALRQPVPRTLAVINGAYPDDVAIDGNVLAWFNEDNPCGSRVRLLKMPRGRAVAIDRGHCKVEGDHFAYTDPLVDDFALAGTRVLWTLTASQHYDASTEVLTTALEDRVTTRVALLLFSNYETEETGQYGFALITSDGRSLAYGGTGSYSAFGEGARDGRAVFHVQGRRAVLWVEFTAPLSRFALDGAVVTAAIPVADATRIEQRRRGAVVRSFTINRTDVGAIKASGAYVATVSRSVGNSHTVDVYETGRLLRSFRVDGLSGLGLSGRLLVVAEGVDVRVFDLVSGRSLTFRRPGFPRVAWSGDGRIWLEGSRIAWTEIDRGHKSWRVKAVTIPAGRIE